MGTVEFCSLVQTGGRVMYRNYDVRWHVGPANNLEAKRLSSIVLLFVNKLGNIYDVCLKLV